MDSIGDLLGLLVSLLRLPLDAVAYALALAYQAPFAFPLALALCVAPASWPLQLTAAARQYPLTALATVAASVTVGAVCWFLLGPLLRAFVATVWWLAWYSPLLYVVGRAAWILCRRYVLGSQRAAQTQATLRQSVQARLQAWVAALMQLLFRGAAPSEGTV